MQLISSKKILSLLLLNTTLSASRSKLEQLRCALFEAKEVYSTECHACEPFACY